MATESGLGQHLMLEPVLAGLSIGVVVQDHTGQIVYGNTAAERLLGISLDQMRGRTSLDPRWRAIREDGSPFPWDAHPAMVTLRTGQPAQDVVMGVHTPDGTVTWIHIDSTPVPGGDGEPVSVVTTLRDVTDSVEARAHQLAAEKKLEVANRSVAETQHLADLLDLGDAFFELDSDFRVLRVNAAQERLTGKPGPEMVGRILWDLWPAASGPGLLYWREYRRCMEERVPVEFTAHFQPKDLWAHVSAYPTPSGGIAVFLRDVSEKTRVEAALRETESRLRVMFEQAAVGMIRSDMATGRFLEVNAKFCEMLGYSREELLARTVWDVTHPGDVEVDRRGFARMAASGVTHRREKRYIRKDGTVLWGEVAANRVVLPGESSSTGVAVVVDITDRKTAEVALDNAHRLMSEGERIAGIGTWEYLVDTQETVWSEGECQIYGVDPHEKSPDYQRMLRERIHPDDAGAVDRTFRQALEKRATYAMEHRVVRPDGSQRVVRDLAHPYFDEAGRLLKYVGISLDVTDRLKTEEALRETESRFRAITERSSDLTLVVDESETITFASPATQRTLGFAPGEVTGKSVRDLVHPEDAAMAGANLARMRSDPSLTLTFDIRLRNAAGTWTMLEAQGRSMLDVPAVRGIVINHRDITERNRLREQFSQAQKLESVGRLAGGVAHDFNNLLTVILGCSESLVPKIPPGDPEASFDLEQIREAAEKARELTAQLLAFARKQVLAPVPLDLNSVLRKSQKMLGRLIGEDVHFRLELQPGLGAVRADPSQIDQVVLNLAVNARDAMPKGGMLVIATQNVSVAGAALAGPGTLPDGDWVQLRVTDTGVGMPQEVQDHLFEPFFTTKEQGKGTGLGLAMIYGAVTQAGGHIHVLSEPGKGTTFTVSLPRLRQGVVDVAESRPTNILRGTERVLVVEDDPQVRSVITRSLAEEGYAVTAVGRPREALEVPQEELASMKLLVTDVVMPSMDGHTLAGELVRRAPGLRVLYVSGYTRDAISERGVLDSGLNFVAKPFNRRGLLSKVREILDG